MWLWWVAGAVLVTVLVLLLLWRPLHAFGKEVQGERARELFKLERERLEAKFFQAAAATGKPRGLRWRDCQWEHTVEFVRERRTGQIAALIGVTIRFEAVEGSDMEGLPAVGNLRNACAVFFFHRGHWDTVGKAVFNMNPDEAVNHFKSQYERIGTGGGP
jgi:hypothetical protein